MCVPWGESGYNIKLGGSWPIKLSRIYFSVAVVFFVLTSGSMGIQKGNIWITIIFVLASISLFAAYVATRKSDQKNDDRLE